MVKINNIKNIVKNSYSFTDVMKKVGLKVNGTSYSLLKSIIKNEGIDTTHFLGKKYNSGIRYKGGRGVNFNIVSKRKKRVRGQFLKDILIREGLKKERCEVCGQMNIWNKRKLVLQINHIDGNHRNNNLSNLQIICPNCHSQTDTFTSKNKVRYK